MLEELKKMHGYTNTEFDSIISSYIESAKKDLEMSGVVKSKVDDKEDKLIYSAIFSYVSSKLDLDNSTLFYESYLMQKDQLRHYGEYINEI